MNANNTRTKRLRDMLALEERRERLQKDLANVMDLMSSLKDSFFHDVVPRATAAVSRVTSPPPPRGRRRGRTPRGALKGRIMAALEEAGAAGVYVKDLAAELATKPVNIHSWFHSTSKRNPSIKKISGGHYRLAGRGSAGKAPRRQVAGKSSPAKSATRRKRGATPQGRRGELSAQIIGQLESAGKGGVNVRTIAEKIGAKNKNIYIWFATTGKKNRAIKKIGPATYRIVR